MDAIESAKKLLPEGSQVYLVYFRVPQNPNVPITKQKGQPRPEQLRAYKRGNAWFEPAPRGGKAVAVIKLPDGAVINGESFCSLTEIFSYKIGRAIALGRAIKQYLAAHGAA